MLRWESSPRIRQRDLTGVGQLVDVAMLDVLTALVFDEPVDHYAATGIPVRTGNADARGAPINAYRCADGWVAVTCTSEGQFERLCTLMEQPELRTRFPDVRARAAGARELDAAIEAWTVTRPARDVEAAFVGIGFPAGRVREPVEAAADPAVRSRALLEELRHPDAPADRPSGFLGARLPIVFDGRVELPAAERFGASTDAVLRELGDCDETELARLRARRGDCLSTPTPLLDGMRVLDAGIWRPVPHATQMLADLGADVCKLEPPGGDPMRAFPTLFRDLSMHKRSVEVDLRTDAGRARALDLAAGVDVFCEGWRPGVADRLGVGYDAISAVNPSIIYCSVSGYGQTGPFVDTRRSRPQLPGARGGGRAAPSGRRRPGDPSTADRRPRRGHGRGAARVRGVGEAPADG